MFINVTYSGTSTTFTNHLTCRLSPVKVVTVNKFQHLVASQRITRKHRLTIMSSVTYSISLVDPHNSYQGFSHNPLGLRAACTVPMAPWFRNKSPRAAWTSILHMLKTLEEFFLSLYVLRSVFHSFSLFLSFSNTPKPLPSLPPTSSHFIRGTERGGKEPLILSQREEEEKQPGQRGRGAQ